jgi:hypothetical protein
MVSFYYEQKLNYFFLPDLVFIFFYLQSNPFKAKGGGMIDMRALKSGQFKQTEDAYDVGIGTQFSAETNTRDEDEEM